MIPKGGGGGGKSKGRVRAMEGHRFAKERGITRADGTRLLKGGQKLISGPLGNLRQGQAGKNKLTGGKIPFKKAVKIHISFPS